VRIKSKQVNWNFPNILMLFGALQGLLLCVFILKKKNFKKAGKYLAIMLFGLSMNLIFYFLVDVGITKQYPLIESFYVPWALLSCVCFYLYIVFSAPFQKKLTTLNMVAFVPFVIFAIAHIIINILWYVYGKELNFGIINFIFNLEEYFGITYCIFLGVLSYREINQIETKIQEQFSNYNISKLSFHKRLLKIMLIFCLVWALVVTYAAINNLGYSEIFYTLWLFIAFVLQWVAWTGFINDKALLPVFDTDDKSKKIPVEVLDVKLEEEEDPSLKIQKTNPLYVTLIDLFENEHVYKEANLSLSILAGKMNISKSYLSALINQTTNQTFYEFVNSYRVNHIISLFEKGELQNFTILSLAFESGFNSKSTFQATFKKITGHTPTQYIKQLKAAI
jgi:AraC-like DNA-binding protein